MATPRKPKQKHTVFVYGTLKHQFWNSRTLTEGNATLIGTAVTVDSFVLQMTGIPFMCDPAKVKDGAELAARVFGEIWTCDDETLERLDTLEGHPHAYCRTDIKVVPLGKGDRVIKTEAITAGAYIYTQPRSGLRIVKPGPEGWINWLADKSLVA